MRIILKTSIFCLLVTCVGVLNAATVDISTNVDRTTIALDEQVNLTLNITADARSIPDPKVPDMEGFEIYSSGSSQSFNFINGQISSSVSYNYILIPLKHGKFTIPPFSVRVKAREYKSEPIEISVRPSGSGPSRSTPSSKYRRSSSRRSDNNEKIFITAELDKKKAYVNEQVTLTFKFYQAIRLLGNPELTRPSYSGFWVEDLPPQRKYYETLNGVRYYVIEIKTALFPSSPGTIEIEPFKITVTPDDFTSFFGRDPFDIFSDGPFGRRRSEPRILRTEKLKLDVKPLPLKGKPANFSGAVGKFSMQAMPDIVETEANQPINFTIRISGTGNIKAIDRPRINAPVEFRSYPSNSSERISKDNYRLSGTRIFEEVLIPKSPGSFDLPPVEFSYFDPVRGGYKSLKSKIYTFKVKPSSADISGEGIPIAVQDIGSAMKDLRYLKTDPGARASKMVLYRSPVFWIIQTLPFLAVLAALIARKYRNRLEDDIAYARSRRAKTASKRVLKTAEKHLQHGETGQFYTAIHKAITYYLADKLSLSAAGLTDEMLRNSLDGKIPGNILDETFNILRVCDFQRFASVYESNQNGREFAKRVEKNIIDLEKSL